ncbi:hypothetical protein V6N12_013234 [Hibiscus sabdariffa]|uniref:Retrotransposon gag protein n=1 Tax=Hibiscus sabdariffa TaxID=183260 RepID=A0ABR2D5X7_9ROSI
MTDKLRNEITSFRQEDDEFMHEAWELYRDLFCRCPMHGLSEWTQVSIFYNSVNTPTRIMLDASANGTLLDKPPREGLEILEKLTQNDYQHPTTCRGAMRRGTAQLDSSDTILAQISALTNMVKNIQKQPAIQAVKGYQNQPRQNQQLNQPRQDYQQPKKYKTLENTLNAFTTQTSAYMARTDQFIQKTDAFMDRTEMRMQNQEAALKSLENQVGQISQVFKSRPMGGFPSDTEVAKGATHEQCKAISTRSGKVLKTPIQSKQGEDTAANSKAADDTDSPAQANIPASTGEDHNIPTEPKEAETTTASPQPKLARKDTLEESRLPPPFPQRLKKQKQEYQYKKFFDILKQVQINLPLVEALQQMPNYAKFLKDMMSRKTRIGEFETAAAIEACLALMHNKVPAKKADLGSFTIPYSIGNNYSIKALCDPGASINLMPKYVF